MTQNPTSGSRTGKSTKKAIRKQTPKKKRGLGPAKKTKKPKEIKFGEKRHEEEEKEKDSSDDSVHM